MSLLEEEGVVIYELQWFCLTDACPVCQALNGNVWYLPTLSGILTDQIYNEVWDMDVDLPLTHPNCRCWLQVTPMVELENSTFFTEIKEALMEWQHTPSNIAEARQEVREFSMEVETTYTQFRMFERSLQRSLRLLKMAGLPPELNQAISVISRAIWTARMLTIGIHSLNVALTLETGGTWQIMNALLGITTGVGMAGDLVFNLGE